MVPMFSRVRVNGAYFEVTFLKTKMYFKKIVYLKKKVFLNEKKGCLLPNFVESNGAYFTCGPKIILVKTCNLFCHTIKCACKNNLGIVRFFHRKYQSIDCW